MKLNISIMALVALISLYGCSGIKPIEKGEQIPEKKESVSWWENVEKQKLNIKPGEVSLLYVEGRFEQEGTLTCNGRELQFFANREYLLSFVSETYFSKLKPYECFYKRGQKSVKVADVNVLPKDFPSERLKVDKKRVFLNKKDAARASRERKMRNKVYAQSPNRPLFFKPFETPIDSTVTSIYGSRRVFNKKKQTQHLGTDYRAPVGEPIRASNRGKVVISRDFFYTGGTVIIDHGLGIFTMYGHLSERKVQEGEVVPEGTVIGLAGASGRVTGPHLHWGVTVNGMAVEGDSLVRQSRGLPSE